MTEYIKKEDVVGLISGGIKAFDATLKTVVYAPTIRRLKLQKGFLEGLLADVEDLKALKTTPKKGQ